MWDALLVTSTVGELRGKCYRNDLHGSKMMFIMVMDGIISRSMDLLWVGLSAHLVHWIDVYYDGVQHGLHRDTQYDTCKLFTKLWQDGNGLLCTL